MSSFVEKIQAASLDNIWGQIIPPTCTHMILSIWTKKEYLKQLQLQQLMIKPVLQCTWRKHQLTDLDQACCCDETSWSFYTFLTALMVVLAWASLQIFYSHYNNIVERSESVYKVVIYAYPICTTVGTAYKKCRPRGTTCIP